jgi:hypothetical protein
VAALLLLMRFGRRAWYWHALAAACASTAALTPLPAAGGRAAGFLAGSVFVLFVVWGAGASFFAKRRVPEHGFRGGRGYDDCM